MIYTGIVGGWCDAITGGLKNELLWVDKNIDFDEYKGVGRNISDKQYDKENENESGEKSLIEDEKNGKNNSKELQSNQKMRSNKKGAQNKTQNNTLSQIGVGNGTGMGADLGLADSGCFELLLFLLTHSPLGSWTVKRNLPVLGSTEVCVSCDVVKCCLFDILLSDVM